MKMTHIWAFADFAQRELLEQIGEHLGLQVQFGSNQFKPDDKHFQIAQTNVKVFLDANLSKNLLELQKIVACFIKFGFNFNENIQLDRLIFTFNEPLVKPTFPMMVRILGPSLKTRVWAKSKFDVSKAIENHNNFHKTELQFVDCICVVETHVLFPFDLV